MKVSVILAHPSNDSFNYAIADITIRTLQNNGYIVVFHDLYQERFDPVLSHAEIKRGAALDPVVSKHCDEISGAAGIIIVHPNWWGQPPAVLKGWVDRVIRAGVAYAFSEGDGGEGVPVGLLKAKAALVFNTSDTPVERELRVFGDPLEAIWKHCIFNLCGIKNFHRKMYSVMANSTLEQRQHWLKDVQETVSKYFPKYGG
ncbi:MAG: NAD(P)H-dependent oxidoreductase [Desulfotomaculaceae bacterium]